MATVNELIEALQDAINGDESIGEREICIGIVTQNKLTRAEISNTYEVVWTPDTDLDSEDEAGEDRFWITVQDDRNNFYSIPDGLRN